MCSALHSSFLKSNILKSNVDLTHLAISLSLSLYTHTHTHTHTHTYIYIYIYIYIYVCVCLCVCVFAWAFINSLLTNSLACLRVCLKVVSVSLYMYLSQIAPFSVSLTLSVSQSFFLTHIHKPPMPLLGLVVSSSLSCLSGPSPQAILTLHVWIDNSAPEAPHFGNAKKKKQSFFLKSHEWVSICAWLPAIKRSCVTYGLSGRFVIYPHTDAHTHTHTHTHTHISSSSWRAASTDIPDPLSLRLPIIHCLQRVFGVTSQF